VPEEARQDALGRALAGEKVSVAFADAIIATWRKCVGRNAKRMTAVRLLPRVIRLLKKHKDELPTSEFARLGRLIQDYFQTRHLRIVK
jgi:hypothetical protein